jgi:hypothetical protein
MLPGNNNGILNPEILYLRYRKPVSATEHQRQTQEGSHTTIRYPQRSSERFNPGYFS